MLKSSSFFKKNSSKIAWEFLGLRTQSFQGIIFIRRRTYKEDFQICISVPLTKIVNLTELLLLLESLTLM